VASSARVAGVGAFVLGGLILFTIGLFMIGDRQMAFAKKFTVYTEFRKITGLQPGAIVRVRGSKAGSIVQILPPDTPSGKFRVKVEIREDLHQLVRTDSVATIETEGLVGGSYLGIGTGSDEAPRVLPESIIAGKEPFDISDLMQQMGDTIAKVNMTIDDMKGDVQNAVVAITDTVNNGNMLITDVSDDVKRMAAAGSRISEDASRIAEGVRSGKGFVGKLMNDDELYTRVTSIARETQEAAASAKQAVELAKKALEGFQSKDGPMQGMSASVKQTMEEARSAMASLADNMDAMKRNFLLRGFFNGRGYFDLAQLSPGDYRKGVLNKKGDRQLSHAWIAADVLFAPDATQPENEQLTDAGRASIDAAIGPSLEYIASGVVIIEGYAQEGPREEQYLRSLARAGAVREYLIGRFRLDPQSVGAMPLGADSAGSPGKMPWDGVAVAVILPKGTIAPPKPPK
jgi:phospholipid/cholesterol/gamma-HCH transport system substrate-binding protein